MKKEFEILQNTDVLFYQDSNFKKNQKPLVLKLITQTSEVRKYDVPLFESLYS